MWCGAGGPHPVIAGSGFDDDDHPAIEPAPRVVLVARDGPALTAGDRHEAEPGDPALVGQPVRYPLRVPRGQSPVVRGRPGGVTTTVPADRSVQLARA
jgi:hypothetical protein